MEVLEVYNSMAPTRRVKRSKRTRRRAQKGGLFKGSSLLKVIDSGNVMDLSNLIDKMADPEKELNRGHGIFGIKPLTAAVCAEKPNKVLYELLLEKGADYDPETIPYEAKACNRLSLLKEWERK